MEDTLRVCVKDDKLSFYIKDIRITNIASYSIEISDNFEFAKVRLEILTPIANIIKLCSED